MFGEELSSLEALSDIMVVSVEWRFEGDGAGVSGEGGLYCTSQLLEKNPLLQVYDSTFCSNYC